MTPHAMTLLEWQRIKDLRARVRNAPTLPSRLSALCDYQGELAAFIDRNWGRIDAALQQDPLPETWRKPEHPPGSDPRISRISRQLATLQRELDAILKAQRGVPADG